MLSKHEKKILKEHDFGNLIQLLQNAVESMTAIDECCATEEIEQTCAVLNEKYRAAVLVEINRDERRHYLNRHPEATADELDTLFGSPETLEEERRKTRRTPEAEVAETVTSEPRAEVAIASTAAAETVAVHVVEHD
jgi:hypothetical protein